MHFCQEIVAACVHPSTHETLPPIGRVAAFAPANLPISVGLVFAPPTWVNMIGWQWVNQTYNAIFNHYNSANQSSGSNAALFYGYLAAVGASCTMCVSLHQVLRSTWARKWSPFMRSTARICIPYTAVASAGFANVFFMRYREMYTGVPVRLRSTDDEQTLHLGHSRIAATKAISEACQSRILLPLPCLLLPPVFLAGTNYFLLSKTLLQSKTFQAFLKMFWLYIGAAVGLPAAAAIAPQMLEMKLARLEPELQAKAKELNVPITPEATVVFNRGL